MKGRMKSVFGRSNGAIASETHCAGTSPVTVNATNYWIPDDWTDLLRGAYSGTTIPNSGSAFQFDNGEMPSTIEAWGSSFRVLAEDHPTTIESMNLLGWFRATCPDEKFRDGAEAVKLTKEACELTGWQRSNYIDELAAAYAETGDFESAVDRQKEAIGLLPEDAIAAWRADFDERLRLYQSGQPFRDYPSVEGP